MMDPKRMTEEKEVRTRGEPRIVHVVSHGPRCFDGIAAATAVVRRYGRSVVRVRFAASGEADETSCSLPIAPPWDDQQLWITDLAWKSESTDRYLRA